MNIFCLDECPIQSAQWVNDKHCVKMPTESIELLAYCFHSSRLSDADCPRTKTGNVRKQPKTYAKHPSTKWVLRSSGNFDWLLRHATEMTDEKLRRYPSKPMHFARRFLDWCDKNRADSIVPDGPMTDFAIAINESMLCRSVKGFDKLSRVNQYRLYYAIDKTHIAQWRANKPSWYNNLKNEFFSLASKEKQFR
jgi:hypothetical protein